MILLSSHVMALAQGIVWFAFCPCSQHVDMSLSKTWNNNLLPNH